MTLDRNVLPCCIPPRVADLYEGIVLGNLFEQTIEGIGCGPGCETFRAALLTEPPQPCRGRGAFWSHRPLAELFEAVAGPLTARRFVQNMTLAWRLTRLRIAERPQAARAELCRER